MNKNIKVSMVTLLIILIFFSHIVTAAGKPVNVVRPEVKDIAEVQMVNSKIEPYQDVNVSSKTGGIIEEVKAVIGQYVEEGQPLLKFEQDDILARVQQAEAALQIARANHEKLLKGSTEEQIIAAESSVRQAEAALRIAKANYSMLKEGATPEDRDSVEAAYQQAVASYEGARKSLELLEKAYEDRVMQKQQLIGAETQLKSAEKQVEVAEERLQQAINGLNQAQNEFERVEYLYQEKVATKKQFEMVESQYQNAKSAVENARIALEQARVSYQGAKENYELVEKDYNNPVQLEQQLASARSQVKIAKANMIIAKANLDKVTKGPREEELTTGEANVAQAEAALERARAQLTQLKNGATAEDIKISKANIKQAEAALKQARAALNDTIIKSPISGIVGQVNFEAGEMAGPGTPLLRIVNLEKLYIRAEVTADLLVDIKKGDQVKARILAYENKYIEGTIEYISPVVDPTTQSFTVKVLVENPDGTLRGGMFADLYFTTGQNKQALVLPVEAVLSLDGNPYVFIVNKGIAEQRPVKVGIVNDEEVSILEGISPDDSVIIRGHKTIQDGEPVEVIN